MVTNKLIRDALYQQDMRLWQLGNLIGKSEATITRMMRTELPMEQQKQIVALITAQHSE